jgi:DNA-binding CsgD family transcriptional regulator
MTMSLQSPAWRADGTSAESISAVAMPGSVDDSLVSGADEKILRRDETLVRAVLDGMAPRDKELLRLSIGSGFGTEEIAVTLGVSPRRARAQVQDAIARFDSRSAGVALTCAAGISCEEVLAIMPDLAASEPRLSEQQCRVLAEHSASCPACGEVLADWNVGAALHDVLAVTVQTQRSSRQRSDRDVSAPRSFRLARPMAVAGSAIAVLVIAGTAAGVSQLTSHTTRTPTASPTTHAVPVVVPSVHSSSPSPAAAPTHTSSHTAAAAVPESAPKKTTSTQPSSSQSSSSSASSSPSPSSSPTSTPTPTPTPTDTSTPTPTPTDTSDSPSPTGS